MQLLNIIILIFEAGVDIGEERSVGRETIIFSRDYIIFERTRDIKSYSISSDRRRNPQPERIIIDINTHTKKRWHPFVMMKSWTAVPMTMTMKLKIPILMKRRRMAKMKRNAPIFPIRK